MTKAEACLWKIADFMCKELKPIIEADGLIHQYEEAAAKDNQRTHNLERAGFKVDKYPL